MDKIRSFQGAAKPGRWAKLVVIASVLALLSGCVVYPGGYYGGRGGGYGHEHYWR